ncbi:MAG: insulinase family protein, partial [Bacteroidetes bacterium]|nr:insulinase family protein [Bacteroidota bacterium]
RAKEQIIGAMMLGLESMSNRMSRLGRDELVFGRDVPVGSVIASIRGVTAEDVIGEARALLGEQTLSSRTILPI